jgi:hypothetical protein
MRCQQYGHTKTYCNRPFLWVKCGGPHSTISCSKRPDTPAKCTLCGGPHRANYEYKGCDHYIRVYKGRYFHNTTHQQTIINTNTYHQPPASPTPKHQYSYDSAVKNNTNNTISEQNNNEEIRKVLNTLLEDFKSMFNQLIQQNSMVLNMLTILIGKID